LKLETPPPPEIPVDPAIAPVRACQTFSPRGIIDFYNLRDIQ